MARRLTSSILAFKLDPWEVEILSPDEREEYEAEVDWADRKLAGYTNRLTPSELSVVEDYPYFHTDELCLYRPDENKVVGSGAWILVSSDIPVNESVRPMTWGIYWATPCHDSKGDGFDSGGRYKVDVLVKHRATEAMQTVSLFPYEYTKVSDELFEELMETNGYTMQKVADAPVEGGMNLELVEKGRSLTEDERSIIWSLQVDGLPESKACEEYFLGRHTDKENSHIWYMPCEECAHWMESTFGRFRDYGRLTNTNHERRAAAKASRVH